MVESVSERTSMLREIHLMRDILRRVHSRVHRVRHLLEPSRHRALAAQTFKHERVAQGFPRFTSINAFENLACRQYLAIAAPAAVVPSHPRPLGQRVRHLLTCNTGLDTFVLNLVSLSR